MRDVGVTLGFQSRGQILELSAAAVGEDRDDTALSARYRHDVLQRGWTGKFSSRLARHVACERRRLINDRPMVSFTFDDVAQSAADTGAPLLESAGERGTYFINTGLIGRERCEYRIADRDSIRALHLRGHEIGLHGHEHRAVGSFSENAFQEDLLRCQAQLTSIHPDIRATNFAYPFGMVDFNRKRQLSSLVRSSRGIAPGINAGVFDPQFLKCVELATERLTPSALAAYIRAAAAANGWLIFLIHDVSKRHSSYGCTPELMEDALTQARRNGLENVTIAAGLDRSAEEPLKFRYSLRI